MNRILLLVASLSLAACGSSSVEPSCTNCPVAWVAKSGTHELTLLGTASSLGYGALDATTLARLNASGRFYAELNPVDSPSTNVSALTQLPADQSLDTMLTQAELRTLTETLDRFPAGDVKKMAPWWATMLFIGALSPAAGNMTPELQKQAVTAGAQVDYLETMDEELSMMRATYDLAALREVLQQRDTTKAALQAMDDAWRAGDVDALSAAVTGSRAELAKARAVRWFPKLEQSLADRERTFVAVGAAHVVGTDGLLAQLRAKGYQVERIQALAR